MCAVRARTSCACCRPNPTTRGFSPRPLDWRLGGSAREHRAVGAAPKADMRHVADAELKTVGAARRIDDDRGPLPQLGVKAQRAAVKDDAAYPRRRGAVGGL